MNIDSKYQTIIIKATAIFTAKIFMRIMRAFRVTTTLYRMMKNVRNGIKIRNKNAFKVSWLVNAIKCQNIESSKTLNKKLDLYSAKSLASSRNS